MQKFINNWSTNLTQSITASDTVIHINIDAANQLAVGFQQGDYYLLTLDDGVNVEIVKVTTINSSTLLAERAYENTTANDWKVGVIFQARITAGTIESLRFSLDNIFTSEGEVLVSSCGNVLEYA